MGENGEVRYAVSRMSCLRIMKVASAECRWVYSVEVVGDRCVDG